MGQSTSGTGIKSAETTTTTTAASSGKTLKPFSKPHNLSLWMRLYIYGLHGYFIEVTFTSIFDFVVKRDWRLIGVSSLWSLGIFGSYGLAMEKLCFYLRRKQVPVYIRAFLYVTMTYFWEYTSGKMLQYYGACPWDYSHYDYNIGGVITLEYAPFWLIGALVSERLLMGVLEQLHWGKEVEVESDVAEEEQPELRRSKRLKSN